MNEQNVARDAARVVIIGGGVIGLSTAYHLGKLGVTDVLLVERNRLTSGTSWHAAGIVGPLRASMNLTRLSIYATELFRSLEAETGQATGYRRTGGLWLARSQDRLTELRRIADMGYRAGLGAHIVSAAECARRFPLLRTDDLSGALWVDEDGQTNPVDTCMAYAKGARSAGVRLREGVAVTSVLTSAGQVAGVGLSDGTEVRCGFIINCAGAWAREVGRLAGVDVPLQAVEHMYVVTDPVAGLPDPCPITRDLDGGIYLKEDAGKLVLGGFEHDAKLWSPDPLRAEEGHLVFPEDWDQFEPFMTAGLHRVPSLQACGIRHFMNGPESFTPDTRQLMGEAPNLRNFFVAAGFNSIGIVSSAGAGRAIAEWLVGGEPPMDLWEVDIARMEPAQATRGFLRARTAEAVANQFDMHWPYRQPASGRNIRRGTLHHALACAGAVFGAPTGWERPLWFAAAPSERDLPLSYGDQAWWPIARREAAALAGRVGLIELSPFTKVRVAGRDATRLLDMLCCGRVDRPVGSVTYTQMLNRRGGIEADVTVTRLEEIEYWVTSGAATRLKDLTWIRRAAEQFSAVDVSDITSAWSVIGVMGPASRALLASLSEADLAAAAFRFSTSRTIDVAAARVRASRVSYVGELGWELYVANEYAEHVYAALRVAGAIHGVADVGLYCVDGCRLEKGYRHFGHDMGGEDSPFEAGLGRGVAFDKDADFIGRGALLAQRERGVARRLLHFAVTDGNPLLLHDEPVFADGRLVGATTSGGLGYRTGRSLCLAYVRCDPDEDDAIVRSRRYEVSVAGCRHRLEALAEPPYDPRGLRLRA